MQSQKRGDLVINKQMFYTLRTLGQTSRGQDNIYEIVYSRKKALKDDNRLFYYSYAAPFRYREMYYLSAFSIFQVASSSLNVTLARPYDTSLDWPFACYVWGVFVGLIVIIFVSDFVFQKRMLFLPCFVFALLSICFHVYLLFLALFTTELEE